MTLYSMEEAQLPSEKINSWDYRTDVFNGLVMSAPGRSYLLLQRSQQINIANALLPDTIYALVIDANKENINIIPCENHHSSKSGNKLLVMLSHLKELELALHESKNILEPHTIKRMEQTRVQDLALVRSILESDNFEYVKEASPYFSTKYVEDPHQNWPPAHCKEMVDHRSSYFVIQNALKRRRELETDKREHKKLVALTIKELDPEKQN